MMMTAGRDGQRHGPNIYKDTKPLMSSLLVFNRVYRLEIQSVILLFSTPLVNQLPSKLLAGSSTPTPPLPCVNMYGVHVFLLCVTVRGGGGSGPQQINTCRQVQGIC
jgi:hypothetical protein